MKQNLHLIILAISCAASFLSCEKGNSEPDPGTPGTQEKMLSKFFSIDTTIATPFDTVSRTACIYDSRNRIVGIDRYVFGPTGDTTSAEIFKFEYAGLDSFAYKKKFTQKSFPGNTVYADTTYYVFDAGKCLSDSVKSGSYYRSSSYSHFTSFIARTRTERSGNPYTFAFSNSKIYLTKTDGEITFQIDTSIAGTSRRECTVHTSYLAKPNPFYALYYPTHLDYLDDHYGLGIGAHLSKKLILQQSVAVRTWKSNNPPDSQFYNEVNYTYEFDADGYPVIVQETLIGNSSTKRRKYVFIYK